MKKVMKKARRDKAKELNIRKTGKKLSAFSDALIIDTYLDGNIDSISSDEILEEFIIEEFGATKGKEQLVALFSDNMNAVLRSSIKNARKEGVPCVPVNYAYFELSENELNAISSADEAKGFVAGSGRGNFAFGCKFIIDTDAPDFFMMAYHEQISNITNGVQGAAKALTEAGNKKKLKGYSSNSRLVKETRGAGRLISPSDVH